MAMDSLDVSRQEPGWFFRELGTKKFAADGIKAGKTFVKGETTAEMISVEEEPVKDAI